MGYEIEVDQEVMDFLRRNAEPFSDTPNSVLRRLLLDRRAAKAERAASPPKVPRKSSTIKKSGRAAAGSLLPEDRYIDPILHVLLKADGRAAYRDVLDGVEELLNKELTETDRAPITSGGIRWHTRLQFVRLRLIERGYLSKDAPRGVWALTKLGTDAAKHGGES